MYKQHKAYKNDDKTKNQQSETHLIKCFTISHPQYRTEWSYENPDASDACMQSFHNTHTQVHDYLANAPRNSDIVFVCDDSQFSVTSTNHLSILSAGLLQAGLLTVGIKEDLFTRILWISLPCRLVALETNYQTNIESEKLLVVGFAWIVFSVITNTIILKF